jgi:Domain of unknown function (DUF4389)
MSTGSWGAQEPQGPGWYQAADGLWYPPEGGGTGGEVVPQPLPGAAVGGRPVTAELDAPLEINRWRPLYAWLLAIPHWIVLYVVGIVAGVCQLIAFFSILFTRRIPPGVHDWIVRYYRYMWQTYSYSAFMREEYPQWGSQGGDVDPGLDPARVTIEHADELNRWAVLYKWILAIPHYFVLAFLFLGAYFAVIIGFFAVLVTGAWPAGLRDYIVNVMRWYVRVQAYVLQRDDEYPPFALD